MTDKQREEGRTGDEGEINGYTPYSEFNLTYCVQKPGRK